MRDRIIFSPWLALAPALTIIVILLGASLVYGIAQSLGLMSGLDESALSPRAYADLLSGQGIAGREFWGSLGFSLWVSLTSTLISAFLALLVAFWVSNSRLDTLALNSNLAFPHMIWAIGLLLLLSQSGLLARWAASLGLISLPVEFPVLVRDKYGIGIILSYIGKEVPFLALLVISVLRTQPEGYQLVAENLGASRWQRIRYVTLPMVAPVLLSGSLLAFAYIFSAYEVPALLGVNYPRMLPVLALRFFNDPDLSARADGMAISLVITVITLLVAWASTRRGEQHAGQ
jgi:putative spermidine/putrescine transport system permease protein